MPTETEEPRTDFEVLQEEEGGPVKSFLEHLEDLRWVLIKIAAAVGVAMLLCLIAGDKVVKIVERPLDKAKVRFPSSVPVVTFFYGPTKVWTKQIDLKTEQPFPLSTNR